MNEKKSCIYSIYGWMGVMGKYTGCFPLPGLYEKREWSKCTKAFINYAIPALNLFILLFGFVKFCATYHFNKNGDLTDILLLIIDACSFAHFILCIGLNYLSLSAKLLNYLKLHLNVDELLKSDERQIKRVVNTFFVAYIVFYTLNAGLPTGFNFSILYQLFCANPLQMLIVTSVRLFLAFILSISMCTNPHSMYIVFHYILKCSFDQLFMKIKKNKNKNMTCEMRVKKMRKYMKFYCDLYKLSTQLDRMVSLLMLITFIQHYMAEIYSLTLTVSTYDVVILSRIGPIVAGIVPLFLVSNAVYFTSKSHNKILPAIYSTFNSNDETVKTELHNFSLQSMYFNKSFSIFGLVQLDRQLILATFQSLISQVIVFYKIHQDHLK